MKAAHIRNKRNKTTTDFNKLYATNYQDLETSSNTSSLEYIANANPSLLVPPLYTMNKSKQAFLLQKHIHPKLRPKTAKVNR